MEWAQVSQRIWDMKYRFRDATGQADADLDATWWRVARALAAPERDPGRWAERFHEALSGFKFLPAGRVIAGAGTGRTVTLFNCFVMGAIPDDMSGIFENLREAGKPAAYVDTGVWSQKAIAESQGLGETLTVASSAATNYDRIPAFPDAASYAHASYLHITTNNTIFGTEYAEIPQAEGGVPLVIDFSSHAGSRPMALERAAFGYAGAQKNLGPSGVTLVYIRKDLLAKKPAAHVPVILRYATHAKEPSLYNTPNTFGVLVLKLVLEWMRDAGGLPAIAAVNERKASKLYAALDASQVFRAHAQPGSRSRMNITFRLPSPELEEAFVKQAKTAGMDGLKGYRTVGGIRASVYNAFPMSGAQHLAEFMAEFARKNG